MNDGCDILVTIYELHNTILPICSAFLNRGPHSIIEYGPLGLFSMGVHILIPVLYHGSTQHDLLH